MLKTLNFAALYNRFEGFGALQKHRKMMPKRSPKSLEDAERHRRTPRPVAISAKAAYARMLGVVKAASMRDAGRNLQHWRLTRRLV